MPSRSPSSPSLARITIMKDSPLLAGTNGEKLWSESTTQTGFEESDRTVYLSGQVTQTIALGSKDMLMFSLSFRLWKCCTAKCLESPATTMLMEEKPEDLRTDLDSGLEALVHLLLGYLVAGAVHLTLCIF